MGLDIIEKIKTAFTEVKPPTVNGPNFPLGFIMTEVIDTKPGSLAGGNPISLALVGNTMPHIPFNWGSEQRVKESWYPGNPEPSIQILGSKQSASMIKGRLTDKRQPAVATGVKQKTVAVAITDVMDMLCARGNILKLELGGWVRYAVMVKTDFKMRHLSSIEYELSFFVISETKPTQNPVLGGSALPQADNAALARLAVQMKSNIATYPSDFPKTPFEEISSVVNSVAKKVAVVTGAVDKIITFAEQTNAGINRAVGAIAALKQFVAKATQRIGAIHLNTAVREATFYKSIDYKPLRMAYPKIPKQNITGGYKNVAHVQSTQRLLRETQKHVALVGSILEAYIASINVRRHLVKNGQTLQNIAVIYYSDAEKWTKIRDHNKLTTTVLVSGSVLEIPQ